MNPSDLNNRLKKLVSKFPCLDLTPNTFLQLVKPTSELLEPYSGYFQKNDPIILTARLLFFPRIILNILKSLSISILRFSELKSWNSHQVRKRTSLFITHFTNAQKPNAVDAFFGELLERNCDNVLYLNSTRLKHKDLLSFYAEESRNNINFMTKSLNPGVVIFLHLEFLVISLKLFLYSFLNSFDSRDKWLLLEAGVRQHSRPTMANKFFEFRINELIKKVQPNVIYFTFEGHSHEAVLIKLVHAEFKDIVLAPYQHAPIDPEQYGLIRNIQLLESWDKIFTSGAVTKDYFQSFRSDLQITAIGSSKYRELTSSAQLSNKVKVIGASEGTVQSLEEFLILFSSLASFQERFDFQLRVHPAITNRELKNVLRRVGNNEVVISQNSLQEDLSTSTYCIYRSSAVAIEGLAFGVTPLYFNQSGDQGLNPLYFANLHLPVFRSVTELIGFFEDISPVNDSKQGIERSRLQQISGAYFSRIVDGLPKDF